jgi:hypothetical protein
MDMSDIDPLKIGVMWQKVETMEREMAEMRHDIKTLLAMAERSKGSLWALMGVASVVGGFITIIVDVFLNKK